MKHFCNIFIGLTTGFCTIHTATRFENPQVVGMGVGPFYYTKRSAATSR